MKIKEEVYNALSSACIPNIHVDRSQLTIKEPEDIVQIKRQIDILTFQLQRMDKSDPKFNTTVDQINSLCDSIPMQWRDYPD